MKILEHEYKVMGLAAYAKKNILWIHIKEYLKIFYGFQKIDL